MSEIPVIISYSNYGYSIFATNLLLNLNTTLKNHPVHFYCLDQKIYQHLVQLNLSNLVITFEILDDTGTSVEFESYGTARYNQITHTKTSILRRALNAYQFVHFIDCDVVCIKEPDADYYVKYKEYDIVFQYDCGFHSADNPHSPTLHPTWTCTGNTTLRNTPGTQYILDRIDEYQVKYPFQNDQENLRSYFQDLGITDIRDYVDTRGHIGTKLYTYPPHEYTNGYWLNHDIGSLESTYFFHANHVVGFVQKIDLLKKSGFWLV
jgi:Nucleotide-diphospho-sugar transferase